MKGFLLLLLFCNSVVYSQSDHAFGWIPKVNASVKINDEIKLIGGIETRETIYDYDFQFAHNLVDISSIVSLKTSLNQSLNIGFLLRLSDEKPVYRFLQHYNIIQSINSVKLAHRIGFEQFLSEVKPNYRARYRATFQKALNGEKVDVKEYYLKLGNEYLWNFEKEDLEIRVMPTIGYKLSAKDKLEIGLNYRMSNLEKKPTKNRFWLTSTWYFSLD